MLVYPKIAHEVLPILAIFILRGDGVLKNCAYHIGLSNKIFNISFRPLSRHSNSATPLQCLGIKNFKPITLL